MHGLNQLQVPVSSRRGLDLTASSRASAPSGTCATRNVGTAALADASQASLAPPVNMVCPSLLLSVCQYSLSLCLSVNMGCPSLPSVCLSVPSVSMVCPSLLLSVSVSIWLVPSSFSLSVSMICPSLLLSVCQYSLSLPPLLLSVSTVCPSLPPSVCRYGLSLPPSLCLSVNMICPFFLLSVNMIFPSLLLSVCQYGLSLLLLLSVSIVCLSVYQYGSSPPSFSLSVNIVCLSVCLSVCQYGLSFLLSVNVIFSPSVCQSGFSPLSRCIIYVFSSLFVCFLLTFLVSCLTVAKSKL